MNPKKSRTNTDLPVPRKRLGQNFLRDANIAWKIVSSLRADADDPVVEIGPGTGALTQLLCDTYTSLTAIEIDPRMHPMLRERCPDMDLVLGSAVAYDWAKLYQREKKPIHIIGNLPYYLTSEILFDILEATPYVSEAVLMIQLEVARRLVALPSTKPYGILSVAVQLVCKPELLFTVSPNVFYPRPDVRSAVVRLNVDASPPFDSPDEAMWTRKVIRTAFNQRRKTLRNSLSSIVNHVGSEIPEPIAGRRAEELTPEDFLALARYLQSGS